MVYGRQYGRSFRGLRRRRYVRRFGYGRRRYGRLAGRRYVRSRLRRRYTRRSRSLVLSRGRFGSRALLPDKAFVKFKFFNDYPLTQPTPPVDHIDFYANNPYDPVLGASAPTCNGFDTLMSNYKSFLVYGCRMKVRFIKADTSAEVFGYIHMPDVNQWSGTTPTKDFLMEGPMNVKYAMLYTYQLNSNKLPVTMSMYRRTKAIANKTELEPSLYAGTRFSGPSELLPCRAGFCWAGSTAITVQVRMYVSITYYTKLFGRNEIMP